MKIAVYTTLFGDYDDIKAVPVDYRYDADWFLFTDHIKNADYYRIKTVDSGKQDLRRVSREYKIRPHVHLPAYDYSIYVDASITLNRSPRFLIEKYLFGADIAVLKHPDRDCIYEEMRLCLKVGIAEPDATYRQAKYYRAVGYPEHNGLTENGVILRRHNITTKHFNEYWNEIYRIFASRDQFSFGFVAWRMGIKINLIPNNIRDNTPGAVREFIFKDHKGR